MPTYCRSSQLHFVHERWGRIKKLEVIIYSCMSLLHRPKRNGAKVREFNFERLDTCSHFDIFTSVQTIRPLQVVLVFLVLHPYMYGLFQRMSIPINVHAQKLCTLEFKAP